jgi:hypothetical protein
MKEKRDKLICDEVMSTDSLYSHDDNEYLSEDDLSLIALTREDFVEARKQGEVKHGLSKVVSWLK